MLGAGGLGSPAALYLAAAGVGTIGIIDMDVVDASNLQRQILHNMDRIGDRKVDSAKKTLTLLNPDVNVVTYDIRLGADNVLDIIDGYDIIVDGTDNFPTRYLLNDASLLKKDIPRGVRCDLPLRGPGQRSSIRTTARATAACCPSRRPPRWRRRAPRPACSACCPASSVRCRRWRRSSSCSVSATALVGRLLTYDALEQIVPHVQGPSRPELPRVLDRSRRTTSSSPSTTSSACRTGTEFWLASQVTSARQAGASGAASEGPPAERARTADRASAAGDGRPKRYPWP